MTPEPPPPVSGLNFMAARRWRAVCNRRNGSALCGGGGQAAGGAVGKKSSGDGGCSGCSRAGSAGRSACRSWAAGLRCGSRSVHSWGTGCAPAPGARPRSIHFLLPPPFEAALEVVAGLSERFQLGQQRLGGADRRTAPAAVPWRAGGGRRSGWSPLTDADQPLGATGGAQHGGRRVQRQSPASRMR